MRYINIFCVSELSWHRNSPMFLSGRKKNQFLSSASNSKVDWMNLVKGYFETSPLAEIMHGKSQPPKDRILENNMQPE